MKDSIGGKTLKAAKMTMQISLSKGTLNLKVSVLFFPKEKRAA